MGNQLLNCKVHKICRVWQVILSIAFLGDSVILAVCSNRFKTLQLIAVLKARMKIFLFGIYFKEFPRSRSVLHGFGWNYARWFGLIHSQFSDREKPVKIFYSGWSWISGYFGGWMPSSKPSTCSNGRVLWDRRLAWILNDIIEPKISKRSWLHSILTRFRDQSRLPTVQKWLQAS
jgi:hypothetical protein